MNQTGGEPSAPTTKEPRPCLSASSAEELESTNHTATTSGAFNPAANVRSECLPDAARIVEVVLKELHGRSGFDEWFHGVSKGIQLEIEESLNWVVQKEITKIQLGHTQPLSQPEPQPASEWRVEVDHTSPYCWFKAGSRSWQFQSSSRRYLKEIATLHNAQVAELKRERNGLLAERDTWINQLREVMNDRNEAQDKLTALTAERNELKARLGADKKFDVSAIPSPQENNPECVCIGAEIAADCPMHGASYIIGRPTDHAREAYQKLEELAEIEPLAADEIKTVIRSAIDKATAIITLERDDWRLCATEQRMELDQLKEERDLWEKRYDEQTLIAAKALEQRDQLKEENAVLKSQVENADFNLEQLRMSLNVWHQKKVVQLKEELEKIVLERNGLFNERIDWLNQLKSVYEQRDSAKDDNERLRKELEEAKSIVPNSEYPCLDTLPEVVTAVWEERTRLHSFANELKRDLISTKDRITALERELSEAKERAAAMDRLHQSRMAETRDEITALETCVAQNVAALEQTLQWFIAEDRIAFIKETLSQTPANVSDRIRELEDNLKTAGEEKLKQFDAIEALQEKLTASEKDSQRLSTYQKFIFLGNIVPTFHRETETWLYKGVPYNDLRTALDALMEGGKE